MLNSDILLRWSIRLPPSFSRTNTSVVYICLFPWWAFTFSVELIGTMGTLGSLMGYPAGLLHRMIGDTWAFVLALLLSGLSSLLLFFTQYMTTFISVAWPLLLVLWMLYGRYFRTRLVHYSDVIMSAMASQITNLTIVYPMVYSGRRSKKTSKLRVTGLCEGNSPVAGEFPAQRASNAENVVIWCRHHVINPLAMGNLNEILDT